MGPSWTASGGWERIVERFKSWLQIFRRMEKQRREDLGHARMCDSLPFSTAAGTIVGPQGIYK